MIYEVENAQPAPADLSADAQSTLSPAPVLAGIPSSYAMTQRAAALLRAYLDANDLNDFRIYRCGDGDALEAEEHLEPLGEAGAAWEVLPPLVAGGCEIASLTHDDDDVGRTREPGVLRLRRHGVVLARWCWIDVIDHGVLRRLHLVAARSPKDITRLRAAVHVHRRAAAAAVWQIVRGYEYKDLPRTKRVAEVDLLLADDLRQRVAADIVRFFDSEVAALYRDLAVPYRRGVLLHGPPGNGKTSLIRLIGARLPDVPVLILRPDQEFDTDDLEEVIRRWTEQAPAILVIEDLNWLLEKVNVSTFLNLLDGVESHRGGRGGLLLVATTNYPDKLDPAVNNRPGRFDVVIEVTPPDRALRLAFLRRHLPAVPAAALESAAQRTRGLSFAHLNEVVRLSGLHALQAERSCRNGDDVSRAVETVVRMNEEASGGFAVKPEMPFGLLPLREHRATAKD